MNVRLRTPQRLCLWRPWFTFCLILKIRSVATETDFIGPLHWFPLATDQSSQWSQKVDQILELRVMMKRGNCCVLFGWCDLYFNKLRKECLFWILSTQMASWIDKVLLLSSNTILLTTFVIGCIHVGVRRQLQLNNGIIIIISSRNNNHRRKRK